MRAFAAMLDRLSLTGGRNAKLTVIGDYLQATPDPDRGYALGALTGDLVFTDAKPAMIRAAIESRMDPVLFGWSYDYVGDLAEAVALAWPSREPPPSADGPQRSRAYPEEWVVGRCRVTPAEAVPPPARAGWTSLEATGGGPCSSCSRWRIGWAINARWPRLGGAAVSEARTQRKASPRPNRSRPLTWKRSGTPCRRPTRELFAWLEGRGRAPPGQLRGAVPAGDAVGGAGRGGRLRAG
jgi:DNA ligase-1